MSPSDVTWTFDAKLYNIKALPLISLNHGQTDPLFPLPITDPANWSQEAE